MKKVLLIAAVAGMAMVSCKKDYTCECTTTDSDDPTFTVTGSYSAKMKKKDADAWCTKYKSSVGTISTECKLK